MDFHEQLKQTFLTTFPTAIVARGGREINMRCVKCPDGKNPRSKHFHISLGYDNEPLWFHCFKCHYKGILTLETLIMWNMYFTDQSLYNKILLHNKSMLSLDHNRSFKDNLVYYINNNYISDNKLSEVKLKYINHRLGTSLTYNDILKNKILLNINDLLYSNNIQKITRDKYIIEQLNNSFIGFISEDNAFLNMRNLTPNKVDKSIDFKYINYNIFGKFDNSKTCFTLPTEINTLSINRTRLNIGEGVFDILSVYHNLRNKNNNNEIYSSILGNRYDMLLKHFILDHKLINLELHVYIDNDINNYIIYLLKNICTDYMIPFYLHRNMYLGEKDFGVPINRIDEQIQKIC